MENSLDPQEEALCTSSMYKLYAQALCTPAYMDYRSKMTTAYVPRV